MSVNILEMFRDINQNAQKFLRIEMGLGDIQIGNMMEINMDRKNSQSKKVKQSKSKNIKLTEIMENRLRKLKNMKKK